MDKCKARQFSDTAANERKCYFPSEPDGHLERSWTIFRLYLVMMLSYLITPPKHLFCMNSGSRLDRQW